MEDPVVKNSSNSKTYVKTGLLHKYVRKETNYFKIRNCNKLSQKISDNWWSVSAYHLSLSSILLLIIVQKHTHTTNVSVII